MKWSLKKEKHALFCYELLVTMVTLAPKTFLDENGAELLNRLINSAKQLKEDNLNDSQETDNSKEKEKDPSLKGSGGSLSEFNNDGYNKSTQCLKLVLKYLQNLSDEYIVENNEYYNSQMQIIGQNVFMVNTIPTREQSAMLEQIGITIVSTSFALSFYQSFCFFYPS